MKKPLTTGDNNELNLIFRTNPLYASTSQIMITDQEFSDFISEKAVPEIKDLSGDFTFDEMEAGSTTKAMTTYGVILYKKIIKLIKASYINRNPLSGSYKKFLARLAQSSAKNANTISLDEVTQPAEFTKCASLIVHGQTGVGKSHSANHAISAIPQVIVHQSFNGQPFVFEQITYLRLSASEGVSPSKLIVRMMAAIDAAIGTNYANQYQHITSKYSNVLNLAIKKLLTIYGIGLVIIDEGQNLNLVLSDSDSPTKVGKFFEELFNSCGVSFVVITVSEGFGEMATVSRLVRKLSTAVPMLIPPLNRTSKDFEAVICHFLRFYNVRLDPLTEEQIKDLIFTESKGILDYIEKYIEAAAEICELSDRDIIYSEDIKRASLGYDDVTRVQLALMELDEQERQFAAGIGSKRP